MRFYNPIRFLKNTKLYISGLVCLRKSKYSEAISLLQQALMHAKENQFPIYDIIKYLGITYWQDKQYQKGKEYLLEAENVSINYLNRKRRIDSELFFYLGLLYDTEAVNDTKENLKKAKEYYKFAIKDYKGNLIDQLTNVDFISSRLIKIDKYETNEN